MRLTAASERRPALVLAIALALVTATGCASDPMLEVRASYARGDYATARDRLVELQRSSADDPVFALERGVVELTVGDPEAAEQALRFARDRLDDLSNNDAADWFAAMLTDDTAFEYQAADYEQVLVRAMLAVSNLMRDGVDAAAYGQQVLERQREIMDAFEDQGGVNPKQNYKLVAFGSYLRGIIQSEDPLRLSEARVSFEKVVRLQPDFAYGADDLARVESGVYAQKGNGVVHVIALVGRGPYREETNEPTTQAALAIAQWIWSIIRDRATIPNIASVKIPRLAYPGGNPSGCTVSVDGRTAGATATVTDVDEVASVEFDAMRDNVIARAVVRRAFKIGVTEVAKEVVNKKDDRNPRTGQKAANPWIDLGISALGILWTALEDADLRCWSLLPASFQVLRVEVPEGDHDIELRALSGGVAVGAAQRVRCYVRDGYNTYVVGLLPTVAGGPPPLTSNPVEDASTPAALEVEQ